MLSGRVNVVRGYPTESGTRVRCGGAFRESIPRWMAFGVEYLQGADHLPRMGGPRAEPPVRRKEAGRGGFGVAQTRLDVALQNLFRRW